MKHIKKFENFNISDKDNKLVEVKNKFNINVNWTDATKRSYELYPNGDYYSGYIRFTSDDKVDLFRGSIFGKLKDFADKFQFVEISRKLSEVYYEYKGGIKLSDEDIKKLIVIIKDAYKKEGDREKEYFKGTSYATGSGIGNF